jgi:PAS domain S-box-containing protein
MPRPNDRAINGLQDSRPNAVWQNRHFWYIAILMLVFTIFYYMDALLNLTGWENLKWTIFYTVHDLHRSLFIIPVVYATTVFRIRGAIWTSALLVLIFLPRAIWISPYPDPLLRAAVFVAAIGLLSYFLGLFINNQGERKKLEKNLLLAQKGLLKETRDYLDSLINRASAPIVAWDREQRITEVNAAFEKLTGYRSAEIMAQPVALLFPAESRQKALNSIQRTLDGQPWESEEIPIRCKDGTTRIILWNSANVYDRDGQTLVTTIAQGQDITALKMVETKAKEESLWRRLLTDQSRDGIVVLDNEGRVYEANQQFAHMLAYTPAEVCRLTVWDWEDRMNRDQIMEMIRTVDENGDHFETRHRRKDGSIYDVEISSNGAVIGGKKLIFCVCRDITDRKKSEELLRQSEAKYASLVEQSNDSILIIENGILRFVNSKAVEISGLSREAIVGRPFADFLPPEICQPVIERHLKRIAGKKTDSIYEIELRMPDGRRVPVEINANMTVFEGRPAVMAIMRNISERKQMEAKTIEMEALKRVDLAKSELLANVSHELRTPLASIKGFIETLLESDIAWTRKQQIDFLMSANIEADHLNLLIRDLLDMSRLDSGRLILNTRLCEVGDIIESISGILSIVTEKHKLKIQPLPLLPAVMVDKSRIGQVIANLVENAAKFSDEGSVINLDVQHLNGDVVFSIEDHGIGIPAEITPKVFDRFYQARRLVDGKTRGTGLGLTICKGIVEAHGGKIWVDSQPGRGSKFYFSIPHQ